MSVRIRTTLLSFLLITTLGSFAASARQQATNLQIDYITYGGTTLTVVGHNLGGASTQVQVAGANAAITRGSDTEIVAETAPLAPGRYKVIVTRDSNAGGIGATTLIVK